VVRNDQGEREMVLMRWGMRPPPRTGGAAGHQHPPHVFTHWRGWLKLENRCLVPANSFAEYAPDPNPLTKKKDVVWFAFNDERPLFAFAGIMDRVQGRPGHQIEAGAWPASGLWFPDDLAECRGCTDPSEGDAGDPDERGRIRRMDARAMR